MTGGGTFAENYRWQQRFYEPVKEIVGKHLIAPAPLELDRNECADFMLVVSGDWKLVCRVRNASRYAQRQLECYHRQATFRSRSRFGRRTEWQRIMKDGYGHWMFYGWGHSDLRIWPWWLIDLDVLRDLHHHYGDTLLSEADRSNGDGSRFHAINPGRVARVYRRPDLVVGSDVPKPKLEPLFQFVAAKSG